MLWYFYNEGFFGAKQKREKGWGEQIINGNFDKKTK